jgi:hypothetical protein
MHAKKVCNEEEEEENQLSFPHQKRHFWLFLCQMQKTRALPILSSGSCCLFRQGHHVQKLPDGSLQSRENVENKSKGIAVVTCQAS